MDLAVLCWGILVSCIVTAGLLTGEWRQLLARAMEVDGAGIPDYRSVRLILTAALLSFFGSVCSWFLVDHQTGLFIGLWVPSILALGAMLNAAAGGGHRQAR